MNCDICYSAKTHELISSQGVWKCQDCRILFRDSIMDIDFYHKKDYWYPDSKGLFLQQKSRFFWFEDYIVKGDSIEFGAANGHVTYLIRMKQPDKYKVVYSEIKDMLAVCYTELDIHKWIGKMEDFIPYFPFKNVFLVDVIEHLRDTRSVFKKLREILKVGGRVFISTNDGDAFDAHLQMFYHKEHNFIFTSSALIKLAREFEFNPVATFHAPQDWMYLVFEKVK